MPYIAVLRNEPKTLCMLGKQSTTELHSQPAHVLFCDPFFVFCLLVGLFLGWGNWLFWDRFSPCTTYWPSRDPPCVASQVPRLKTYITVPNLYLVVLLVWISKLLLLPPHPLPTSDEEMGLERTTNLSRSHRITGNWTPWRAHSDCSNLLF